ncbi:hypothetical protein HDE_14157 [Halotydeus destructor]|nr:hypothetical protein HDE_14157 [Halotydeus destructor]
MRSNLFALLVASSVLTGSNAAPKLNVDEIIKWLEDDPSTSFDMVPANMPDINLFDLVTSIFKAKASCFYGALPPGVKVNQDMVVLSVEPLANLTSVVIDLVSLTEGLSVSMKRIKHKITVNNEAHSTTFKVNLDNLRVGLRGAMRLLGEIQRFEMTMAVPKVLFEYDVFYRENGSQQLKQHTPVFSRPRIYSLALAISNQEVRDKLSEMIPIHILEKMMSDIGSAIARAIT